MKCDGLHFSFLISFWGKDLFNYKGSGNPEQMRPCFYIVIKANDKSRAA